MSTNSTHTNKKYNLTVKQAKAIENMVKKGMSVSKAMEAAGYSAYTAHSPKNLTDSKGYEAYRETLEKKLPANTLATYHEKLLKAGKMGSRQFPVKTPDSAIRQLISSLGVEVVDIRLEETEFTNAKGVKKTNKHKVAYFIIMDTKAVKEALDLAYKVKGNYAKSEHNVNFQNETSEALAEQITRLLEELCGDTGGG